MIAENLDSFSQYLNFFPDVEFPVVLSSEYMQLFSKENKPLPEHLSLKFMTQKLENEENDVEYIACFKFPPQKNFHAVIFLKIDIMNYQYVLQTFDVKGVEIDRKKIAGMEVVDQELKEKVALIDEDLIILNMKGSQDINEDFDIKKSTSFAYEILEDGKISGYKI